MTNQGEESSADTGDELVQAQPDEPVSQYVETEGHRALHVVRSPDGRHRVPNPNGLTRDELRDVGTLLDSQIAGSVAEGPGNNGDAHTLAALRFESDVEESAPRNPLERALVGSVLLTAELQRRLLLYAAGSKDPKSAQRWSALALNASNDVRRGCLAFDALRRPSVKIGNAGQVNVSGGDQAIQNNAVAPDSPTVDDEARRGA